MNTFAPVPAGHSHRSLMLFNLAASRVTGEERENAVTNRDLDANQLTPDALNEAQRLAREWDAAHPQ